LALTLTAIFIVKKQEIIGSSEKLIHNNEDIDDTDLYRNVSNKLNENKVEETIEKINSLTTTTIGPTTTKESVKPSTSTPQSTTPKEIDYILVTVIVNRATVPDEDIAFYAKTSDSFVDLYLDGTKIQLISYMIAKTLIGIITSRHTRCLLILTLTLRSMTRTRFLIH
jgi:hypothetical protein